MVPRCYYPHPLAVGETVVLPQDTSHHLLTVLRLKTGQPVIIFNGFGEEFQAEFVGKESRNAAVRIVSGGRVDRESPLAIHLFQGVTRPQKMDWIIQKAVELGVHTITPLFTEKTVVRLAGERLAKKNEHWQQIIISAAEQSGRTILPSLGEACRLRDLTTDRLNADMRLVADPLAEISLNQFQLDGSASDVKKVALMIGPEGGFSSDELQFAKNCGFVSVKLGPRILRAETAPLVALTLLQGRWGDL